MVSKSKHAFEELTPDTIIQAIENTGVLCDDVKLHYNVPQPDSPIDSITYGQIIISN